MTRLERLRNRLASEEGSLSAWVLLTAVVLVAVLGLVVDSAGKYQADERAHQVASNAARAAANSLSGDAVQRGDVYLDAARAQQTARDYIAASGLTGTVTITGQEVSVEVETSYTTKFISLLGVNTLPASGTASALLITN